MDNIAIDSLTFTDQITIEDYNALRKSVDWMLVVPRRAKLALENSYYVHVAVYEGRPIGMVRIVSDGGWSFLITDVIVRPEFQGKHIGKKLISDVMEFIQKDLLDGETVMVSLMSAYQKEGFYEKFGFNKRPFGNHGSGMSTWITRGADGSISKK